MKQLPASIISSERQKLEIRSNPTTESQQKLPASPSPSISSEPTTLRTFIIPLYNGSDLIPDLLRALTNLHNEQPTQTHFILVLDGPDEACESNIAEFARGTSIRLDVLTLTRHVGVAGALFAGLASADSNHTVICFGGDLQEPLATLIHLAEKVEEGADVVLGQRISRRDGFFPDLFSATYWKLATIFIDRDLPRGGFDVFALSPQARASLLTFPGTRPNITTQLFRLGFKIVYIQFDRIPRQSGKSSWTVGQKIRLAVDSLFVTNPRGVSRLLSLYFLGYLTSILILCGILAIFTSTSTPLVLLAALAMISLLFPLVLGLTFLSYQISVLLDEYYQSSKFEVRRSCRIETS